MKITCLNTEEIIDFRYCEAGMHMSQDCGIIEVEGKGKRYVLSADSLREIVALLEKRMEPKFNPDDFLKKLIGTKLSQWTETNLIRPVGVKLDLALENGNDQLSELARKHGLVWEEIRFVSQTDFEASTTNLIDDTPFGEDETRLWIVYDDATLKVSNAVWG